MSAEQPKCGHVDFSVAFTVVREPTNPLMFVELSMECVACGRRVQFTDPTPTEDEQRRARLPFQVEADG